jgi:hypothetical protein
MTAAPTLGRCAHIACTDARRISGTRTRPRTIPAQLTCVSAISKAFGSVPGTQVCRLLMRFGSDPIRGSNPRSSAEAAIHAC